MKRKLTVGSLIMMFFLLGLNISYIPSVSSVPVPNPNTYTYYRLGSIQDPIDPPRNWESIGTGINELVYESLTDYAGNSSDTVVGELATSWTISGDGLNYTFYLRDNVYFHDGVHFNAYVMKYSIDRAILLRDYYGAIPAILPDQVLGSGIYNSYLDANVSQALDYLGADGVEVIDDFTLKINLARKDSSFLRILTTPFLSAVSPKAIIDNIPMTYTTNVNDDDFGMVPLDSWFSGLSDWTKLGLSPSHNPAISGVVPSLDIFIGNEHYWMENHAVGTGPYILANITNDDLRFEQYIGWWGEFHPNAPDVILILNEPSEDLRISHLLDASADQIQLTQPRINDFVYPNGTLIYPFTKLFLVPSFVAYFLSFNMFDTISTNFVQEDISSSYNGIDTPRYSSGTENATKENPFTSLYFRQGFSNVFDYQGMIDSLLFGYGERLEGLVPNGMFGHIDDLIDNGYIPSYNLTNAEILFNQVGWKGNITLFYNTGNILRETIHTMIKNSVESLNVGINISVSEVPWPTYLDLRQNNSLSIFTTGWAPDYADPSNYLQVAWQTYYSPQANYTNPTTFSYIDQQAMEMNDAIRLAQIRAAEEQLAQDNAVIYIYQPYRPVIVRDWIQGFPESGSFNPISVSPNYQFIGKPGEWPAVTTITESTTETETAMITETITETITSTQVQTQTVTVTSVLTSTVPSGVVTTTETETQTETVTVSDIFTTTETLTKTITTSNVVSITTTDGGFEFLIILGTIGLIGVIIKRRKT